MATTNSPSTPFDLRASEPEQASLFDGDVDFDVDGPEPAPPAGGRRDVDVEDARKSIDALIHSAGNYGGPQEYRELLRFVSRLPEYRPFNRMLIHVQKPGAEYVATANRWLRTFKRTIRPGVRPLVILQPRGPVRVVFDVDDTEPLVDDAPPVPRSAVRPLEIQLDGTVAQIDDRWRYTELNAIRDGIRITLVDDGGHSGGRIRKTPNSTIRLSRPATGRTPDGLPQVEDFPLHYELEINRNLSPTDRYATLIHELAHLYCGHLGSPDTDHWPDRSQPILGHATREIEAESVVHMLLARIDPDVRMGDYIQGHLDKTKQVPPSVSLNAMMRCAGLIEEMGEHRMPRRRSRPTPTTR
ncbi:hypothetical protein GCG21_15965 [Pseudactinotalea sp. HY160]|uniref:ImmA/IrrE family metallo-endopeptidase n=1 Tax=Pseudactinotalea sp. HY160 TaxID=2654490 RepID=UPI00128BDC13|nr:ImmA/IrrE family metallo-endopeptidase [Pseudactinotalea sp. HY160]MPV51475.1 hypothetical protein [Pseudactinotalea sp. HY160]